MLNPRAKVTQALRQICCKTPSKAKLMQHLTAKKLLPRPVALWHHSFCSNFWCNQTARSKAELTEVLALRSTEHFKAKGWNPGHAEVNGNFATNFNETKISPGEFSKRHFSASTLIIRIVCCGEQRQCKWREGGRVGKDCGTELKGSILEVHPGWENKREQQKTAKILTTNARKWRGENRSAQKTTARFVIISDYFLIAFHEVVLKTGCKGLLPRDVQKITKESKPIASETRGLHIHKKKKKKGL